MFGFGFDFMYLLFIAPALLLAMLAQWMVRSAYEQMSQVRASMSGYEAARRILDAGGLHNVDIEQIPGQLSDHYDPGAKVLRLSPEVFSGHSMASVGIAAHEAGHALQDARGYAPLKIRNLAVPAANFGSSFGTILLMIGMVMVFGQMAFLGKWVFLAGIVAFGATVAFQLVNLPVEFDASSRAKVELINLGIISGPELPYVSKVLNAAALTYVAATLQAVLTLAYYIFRFMQATSRER
ncbi:MAG: zinc metallopeptidase [Pirellulaceae bacterium]|nr:zinc metallopeptidase [Pirellulaceae bacterium]